MSFDLKNTILTPELAWRVYKLAVSNLTSSKIQSNMGVDGFDGRKDKKFFEDAATEFRTAEYWFFYIMYYSIRDETIYIRNLMQSNNKQLYKRVIKSFFDNPARHIVSDIQHIHQLLEMDLTPQIQSDILSLRISPMSYAWISKNFQVDFVRHENLFIQSFKRKIEIMQYFLTLNSDAEALIRNQVSHVA